MSLINSEGKQTIELYVDYAPIFCKTEQKTSSIIGARKNQEGHTNY